MIEAWNATPVRETVQRFVWSHDSGKTAAIPYPERSWRPPSRVRSPLASSPAPWGTKVATNNTPNHRVPPQKASSLSRELRVTSWVYRPKDSIKSQPTMENQRFPIPTAVDPARLLLPASERSGEAESPEAATAKAGRPDRLPRGRLRRGSYNAIAGRKSSTLEEFEKSHQERGLG